MNTALLRHFLETRELSNSLCLPLEKEDYVVQTLFDVSPIKWHLGHTTWFFESFILNKYRRNYTLFHEKYPYIFNSYYNSLGDRVSKDIRGILSRPTVDEIMEYREYVNSHLSHFIENNDLDDHFKLLLKIGINHEQQHQELMIYDIKHILFTNPILSKYHEDPNIVHKEFNPKYISFDEELITIGAKESIDFAFDNEFPEHKVYINAFQLRDTLISNAEYLEFINDQAYQKHEFWLDDAWYKILEEKWQHPLYWKKENGEWFEWTLHGYEKLIPNKAVSHISYYEADAFARWAGKRLATEFEWEHASTKFPQSENCNFLDNKLFDTYESENALNQIFGNLWEWTSSSYQSYPGYKKPEGAIGEYNAKFMSGQMILRGGSYATSKNHFRNTYRNFFQADKRWLISGIRLAESL